MTRLPGDPGAAAWLRSRRASGCRPRTWTGYGTSSPTRAGAGRTVLRHLAVIIPICAIVAALLLTLSPAPAWFAVMMVLLILCGSIFTVVAYADDIRASRLRQHGLDVPDDPDLGHPTH